MREGAGGRAGTPGGVAAGDALELGAAEHGSAGLGAAGLGAAGYCTAGLGAAGLGTPGHAPLVPGTFVPWPLPLAVGVISGVIGTSPLGAAATWLVSLLLAAGGAYAWRRLGWRWPHALPSGRPLSAALFLPVVAVAASVGAARMQVWQSGADARQRAMLEAGVLGEQREWRGRSDGDVLHATHPVRSRLAIVMPAGTEAPVGEVVLVGTAEQAPGKRNPGGFDYAAHLRRRGVVAQLFVRSATTVRPATLVADRLAGGVAAGLAPPVAALMLAMTLGRRDDLGDLRDAFGASGMSHLLALSGLHVGVLLLGLGRLLQRMKAGRLPLLAAATLAFVGLVGPSPSVVRAAAMGLAALATAALGAGRAHALATLSLAALIGTLLAPQMVADLGFQLSYLAVLGMLVFLPPWTARLGAPWSLAAGGGAPGSGWRGRVRALAALGLGGALVSVAAQLPTFALVAGTFGAVPLASPLVNAVAVPLTGLLVPLGFLAGAVGLVWQPLAWLVNLLVGPLAAALIWLAEVGARLPSLAWGEVGAAGHAAWVAFCTALAAWSRGRLRLVQVLALALVLGGVTYALPAAARPPDVWFLDVGQGDAALIRLAGGSAVLVDGGGTPFSDYDVGKRVVLPALRALGVSRLDAVVATHPDADHVEGLVPVLESVPVGLLVMGPELPGSALDAMLREVAARRRVPVREARRGERLVLDGGAVVLDIVNPPADTGHLGGNEASVAFVLRHRGVPRVLFTGDLGLAVEPDLAVPPLDVLKVGHHGSRGSTGDGLVRAAGPRLAVVSVGRNTYGHPTPEVIGRLEASGAVVLTTQEHGAVRVELSGAPTWSWMGAP